VDYVERRESSICLHCLRSFERHAADDESFRFLSEDGGLALLGLVETVELADPRIVFDGSESAVGQSDRTSLDVLEQVLGERLV
jgi:hypothetical protein